MRDVLALIKVNTAPDRTVFTLSQVLITAAIAAVNNVLEDRTNSKQPNTFTRQCDSNFRLG